MKLHRSLLSIVLLVALLCGSLTASAQTATPTATPTPGTCSITGPTIDCRTGAEPPGAVFGVSGGNFKSIDSTSCCTGTFGAMVQDSKGNQFILSNNHVLARTSSTRKKAALGEMIVQPGLVDLGCWQDTTDQVGKLSKFVPLNFSRSQFNRVDAALAANSAMDSTGFILNLGQISPTVVPVGDLVDGMFVQKMGRTSCLTTGQIDAFDAFGKIAYDKGCNSADSGVANFNHQILVVGAAPGDKSGAACVFTKPGDSGSLIVTLPLPSSNTCPQPVGLLFAATSGGDIGIVNPIQTVLNAFSTSTNKLSIVGNSQCPISIGAAAGEQSTLFGVASMPSAALRASREQVRAAKERHAGSLLKLDEVVAVGIGAGADSDHAALNVYVKSDTPEVRAKILSQIDGVPVKIKQSAEFHAL